MSEAEAEGRRGLTLALLAYTSWALLALYWKLLAHVPALEQLVHRVVWAAVCLVALLATMGRLAELRALVRDRDKRRRLYVSAALVATNWFVFVYAVATDRVLHVSLGYYINPLISVCLGMIVLGERLRRLQWAAVVAALAGIVILLAWAGELPWIGVTIALAFGFYGLARKTLDVEPLPATAFETLLLTIPCLAVMSWFELGTGAGYLLRGDAWTRGLLLVAGPATALPLLWFTGATRRLSLTAIGFLQYITPTGHFLFAVLLFDEPFTLAHRVAFVCIWTGVALFIVDRLLTARARPSEPGSGADAGAGA